jgi:hypothetical protein
MHDPIEAIAIFSIIAFSGTGALMLIRALSRRIAGGGGLKEVAELREEIEALHADQADMRARLAQMDDIQGRLDFAERVLAQVREKGALPPGGRS